MAKPVDVPTLILDRVSLALMGNMKADKWGKIIAQDEIKFGFAFGFLQ